MSSIMTTPCLSCGEPASLSCEDGTYCVGCMQAHILEKMFVQLTKLQGRGYTEPLEADEKP